MPDRSRKRGYTHVPVPDGIKELDNEILDRLIELRCDPNLLRNLWDGSDLPFPHLRTG
jgi:hypothetical protein